MVNKKTYVNKVKSKIRKTILFTHLSHGGPLKRQPQHQKKKSTKENKKIIILQ